MEFNNYEVENFTKRRKRFVKLLHKHPVLLLKSNSSSIKEKKKAACESIAKTLNKSKFVFIKYTGKQVAEELRNLKSRAKRALKSYNGHCKIEPEEDEKDMIKWLQKGNGASIEDSDTDWSSFSDSESDEETSAVGIKHIPQPQTNKKYSSGKINKAKKKKKETPCIGKTIALKIDLLKQLDEVKEHYTSAKHSAANGRILTIKSDILVLRNKLLIEKIKKMLIDFQDN